jgi:hypothetical protein
LGLGSRCFGIHIYQSIRVAGRRYKPLPAQSSCYT